MVVSRGSYCNIRVSTRQILPDTWVLRNPNKNLDPKTQLSSRHQFQNIKYRLETWFFSLEKVAAIYTTNGRESDSILKGIEHNQL